MARSRVTRTPAHQRESVATVGDGSTSGRTDADIDTPDASERGGGALALAADLASRITLRSGNSPGTEPRLNGGAAFADDEAVEIALPRGNASDTRQQPSSGITEPQETSSPEDDGAANQQAKESLHRFPELTDDGAISKGVDSTSTSFRYHVDEISSGSIEGWLMAPHHPSRHYAVALKEGDRVHARVVASRFREDLVSAGIGDGCYSFQLSLPPSLFDGAEHLLDLVEEETGFHLTSESIRWRSAVVSDVRTSSHGTRVATETRHFLSPKSYACGSNATHARVLFDISDLVYYIGHHANLTGIQRVQSSIVLSVLDNDLLPRSELVFLSFDARNRNWVSIPTGFLGSLLTDLLLPEPERLVTFPADEARYGILPGAREFDGVGALDDGNPSVLCLLGAA
jgi:hypothetical protein